MVARKTSLFTQHSRSWRDNHFVYPVISRRSRGLSIGINLNPDTACNFDCIYCCVDRTQPPKVTKVDLDRLAGELEGMLALAGSGEIFRQPPFDKTPPNLARVNDIAFSGDGEPTSYGRFGDACRLAVELRDRHGMPGAKIITITNATLLHRPAVARAMAWLDGHNGEIWAKLDAGTEAYYRAVDRTTIPLSRVLENILAAGRIRPILIQSMFMRVAGHGPDDAEMDAYVGRLCDLVRDGCRIKLVQVYTIARPTATTDATPLEDAAVDRIADRVRSAGLNVESYYSPG